MLPTTARPNVADHGGGNSEPRRCVQNVRVGSPYGANVALGQLGHPVTRADSAPRLRRHFIHVGLVRAPMQVRGIAAAGRVARVQSKVVRRRGRRSTVQNQRHVGGLPKSPFSLDFAVPRRSPGANPEPTIVSSTGRDFRPKPLAGFLVEHRLSRHACAPRVSFNSLQNKVFRVFSKDTFAPEWAQFS